MSGRFIQMFAHFDAETPGFSIFVDRALIYIMTEVFNTKIPPLKGVKFVPRRSTTPPGAKTVTYKRFTQAGIAQWITNYGADMPTASFWVKESSHQIYDMGISYRYTIKDLIAAMYANSPASPNGGPPINIDMQLAGAALIGIEKRLDATSVKGTASGTDADGKPVPDLGLLGLLNQPNANIYTVPNGATGSQRWSSKTPDEIVADVNGIASAQNEGTYETEAPTRLITPVGHRGILAKRMGDGSDTTILKFIEANSPWFGAGSIDQWQYCKAAGAGGTDRMVAYNPDISRLWHEVPVNFRQEPPQLRNLEVVVPCWASSGGVIVTYPLSISYGDGI